MLERTPPELSADILDRGIVLTGGGALLRGLEELIEERTGIHTMTAEDPMQVVAIGTGQFVEFMSENKKFHVIEVTTKGLLREKSTSFAAVLFYSEKRPQTAV